MKPVINLEETIGKTVGRRVAPTDSLQFAFELQRSLGQFIRGFPIRRGVYRFHSHEDADVWMMNSLVRKKAN